MEWREVIMENPLNRTVEEELEIQSLLSSGWQFWGGAHEGMRGYTQLFKRFKAPMEYSRMSYAQKTQ